MSRSTWKFSIIFDEKISLSTTADGIFAASAEDVVNIGSKTGLQVKGRKDYLYINVDCEESDPALKAVIDELYKLYLFRPTTHRIVPVTQRDTVYGVDKERHYTSDEISEAPYLLLRSDREIAKNAKRSPEESEKHIYVVKNYVQKKSTLLGVISPYSAIAVDDRLQERLEAACLQALLFDDVRGAAHLRKLSSEVTLPQCLLPLVNGSGEAVSPLQKWGDHEERWFDDGYGVPELVYKKEQIDKLPKFDIAMTLERVGQHNSAAFQWCVVSQQFRAVLNALGVKGTKYNPVRLV